MHKTYIQTSTTQTHIRRTQDEWHVVFCSGHILNISGRVRPNYTKCFTDLAKCFTCEQHACTRNIFQPGHECPTTCPAPHTRHLLQPWYHTSCHHIYRGAPPTTLQQPKRSWWSWWWWWWCKSLMARSCKSLNDMYACYIGISMSLELFGKRDIFSWNMRQCYNWSMNYCPGRFSYPRSLPLFPFQSCMQYNIFFRIWIICLAGKQHPNYMPNHGYW